MAGQRLKALDRAQRRRALLASIGRCALSCAVVVGLYYLLPLGGKSADIAALSRAAVGALVFIIVMAYQVRCITRADLPELRAVEALAVALSLFLVLLAGCYVSLSHADPSSFSEHLDHTGALYFAIVTLGTVGYGDIAAKSDLARIMVSTQVLVDLVFLATVLRVLLLAARSGLKDTAVSR